MVLKKQNRRERPKLNVEARRFLDNPEATDSFVLD